MSPGSGPRVPRSSARVPGSGPACPRFRSGEPPARARASVVGLAGRERWTRGSGALDSRVGRVGLAVTIRARWLRSTGFSGPFRSPVTTGRGCACGVTGSGRCSPCCSSTPTSRCPPSGSSTRCGPTCRRSPTPPTCTPTSPASASGSAPSTTPAAGYRLRVDDDDLDLLVFRREAAMGRATRDPRTAADHLRHALAQWRDQPLADLTVPAARRRGGPAGSRAVRRLRGLRRGRARRRPARGPGRRAAAAVAEHPLRERLVGLLMTALWRSGRQVEALDAYRRTRATLIDETGLEPGPELREVHAAILRGDDANRTASTPGRSASCPPRSSTSPAATTSSTS